MVMEFVNSIDSWPKVFFASLVVIVLAFLIIKLIDKIP